jgi:transposase
VQADRAGVGKSDPIDAVEASRQVLHRDMDVSVPRADGLRAALRVLLTGRRGLDTRRTADRNALNARARTTGLGVDARKALTDAQVTMIAGWEERAADAVQQRIVRQEAARLAAAVKDADRNLRRMKIPLKELVEQLGPGFLARPGIGLVTAAVILCASSHRGLIRSETAFAALAGNSPLPASSGNTVRRRLNRHGDRQLNMDLEIIVKLRMVRDETTTLYAARRTGECRTYREIKRVLKRYAAREIYCQLTNPQAAPNNTDLRQMRTTLGCTITTAARELGQWPSKISLLERGLLRNDTLATDYRQWLTEQAAQTGRRAAGLRDPAGACQRLGGYVIG